MIDERIENSLTELEQSLKNIETARQQVERIASSYDGLKGTIDEYVRSLNTVTTKIRELIDNVVNDYSNRVNICETDRTTIVNATDKAIKKLSDTTNDVNNNLSNVIDDFKKMLLKINRKENYILTFNAIIAILVIILHLLR